MSDEPRLSNVSDLLRQSNQQDEEERVKAKLHASASLFRPSVGSFTHGGRNRFECSKAACRS